MTAREPPCRLLWRVSDEGRGNTHEKPKIEMWADLGQVSGSEKMQGFAGFSQGRKSSRRKGWGCSRTPTRLTSDGNADRIRLFTKFPETMKKGLQTCPLDYTGG